MYIKSSERSKNSMVRPTKDLKTFIKLIVTLKVQ